MWCWPWQGCGGDSGPAYDPNCPLCEPEGFEDHTLQSCQIHYEWNGVFYYWTNCETGWMPVANQPVFTSLNDCLIAQGHLLDENDAYWDNSQQDKDRGYAWELFCFATDLKRMVEDRNHLIEEYVVERHC